MKIKVAFLFACLFCHYIIIAQPNKKFGIVKPEDFTIKSALIDSSTNAIILYDVGTCEFEGNSNGWFSIVYTKHTRIKILNKNGYDAATVKELLYVRDKSSEELFEDLKASTFNLVNNAVVETKFNKNDLISSKINNTYVDKVFTLPDVKEGCIIEYTYKIRTEYINHLKPWKFENEYPCLYNEFKVAIPSIFRYVSDVRENIPLVVTRDTYSGGFVIADDEGYAYSSKKVFTVQGTVFETKWVAKEIAKVKEEPLLRSLDNYISKVDFQLVEIRIPNQPVDYKYNSWEKIGGNLRKSPYFGEQIFESHHWLKEPLNTLTEKLTDTLQKVKVVYDYIKDNFSKTKETGIFLSDNVTLKDVFNNKKGSAAELNMLLNTMLRRIGVDAEPTILSTRENGVVHPFYPIISEYNYLVVRVRIAAVDYFLDASESYLGFNKLPLKCYNGYARVLSEKPYAQLLSSDSIKEKENVFVIISSDDKSITANFQQDLGYYNSQKYRTLFGKKSLNEIGDILKKEFSTEVTISDLVVDSLKALDVPLKITYNSTINISGDIVYINPLFNYAIKENPFKADNRKYPIEKPYASNLLYVMSFNVPPGYKVDEIPKSVKANLNDDEGYFEYLVSVTDDLIQMRCKLNFEKANYKADDYQSIRDFYGIVVKKMSEEIVLKKITK